MLILKCCRSDMQFAVTTSSTRRSAEVGLRTRPDASRVLEDTPRQNPEFPRVGRAEKERSDVSAVDEGK